MGRIHIDYTTEKIAAINSDSPHGGGGIALFQRCDNRYNHVMELKELYREILNEHNINPSHKESLEGANLSLQGINPSCGDNITLNLKTEKGKITDGAFSGSGCAISQASCDMMLDLIIGKEEKEALRLCEIFMGMIQGKVSDEEIEELDEASALREIQHMPARVKCAELGWRTMREMLGLKKDSASASLSHPDCPTK